MSDSSGQPTPVTPTEQIPTGQTPATPTPPHGAQPTTPQPQAPHTQQVPPMPQAPQVAMQQAAVPVHGPQAPKMPLWKRTYKLTALVLGVGVLASIAVGAIVSSPIAYHAGRNAEVTNILLDQARDKTVEYKESKEKLDDVNSQLRQANEDYESLQEEYGKLEKEHQEAKDIIEQAQKYNLPDLKSESEKLKKEVDEQKKTLETLTGKVESAKKNTIGDGVWQVGKDIDAGTYRATSEVGGSCYWEVSNPSTNDIIQNDIPGGGFPEVTVSNGQQLKISDCKTFAKQ